MKKILTMTVLIIFVLSSMITAFACESDTDEPTPQPTPGATPTPQPEPTPGVTPTPQPEPTPAPMPSGSDNPYEILISEQGLDPITLTVPVGTTVTWYNADTRANARHWMKALDGSFDTRAIPGTARMSVTFDEAGVYEYECIFHRDREAGLFTQGNYILARL